MSADVTVAVAGDPVEADEIRAVLRRGGIESRLEAAEVVGEAALLDGPCRVLVEGDLLERAMELLEADDDDEDEDDE
ncbi:MAG: putative prokaryotic signal transducing protein [Gaiellales bacterium]|nr:putative prokaryotic signal transducing protein [Gaiellales bacterium]